MRLLYVAKSAPSLSETFVRDEISFFRSRGHSVHFICHKPQRSSQVPPSAGDFLDNVHVVKAASGWQWVAWKATAEVRKRLGVPYAQGGRAMARCIEALSLAPDALIAHFGPNVLLAAEVKRHLDGRPPLLGVFHGYDISLDAKKYASGYVRNADAIDRFISISDHGNRILRSFGIAHSKIRTIRLGVNIDAIPTNPMFADRRPATIVSVGRLVEKKGFDTLIDAFAQLPAHVLEQTELQIIGDGPLSSALRRRAAASEARRKIRFLGALPHAQVLQHIAAASAFVLASRTSPAGDMEGIPVVLMESMAAGTPVVSTRHAGIPELIEDGVTGLLVGENDPPALRKAVLAVMENQDEAQRRSGAAQDRIRVHFNRQIQNRVLEAEIEDLVNAREHLDN